MSKLPEPPSSSSDRAATGYNLAYLSAPGVQFLPTDQELIVDYLQRKLRGEPPLYADDAVNDDDDIDVYSEHPKDLVRKLRKKKGCVDSSWYLFSPRSRKYGNGERPRRNTDDGLGFWKSTGAKKDVLDGKEVIGHRCGLTYHVFVDDEEPGGDDGDAKPNKRLRKPTDWKMVEFISVNTDRRRDKTAANPMLLNDYVLCKITNKNSFEVEEKDHDNLSRSGTDEGEEEQGAPSDGGDASQDDQDQSTPSEGPACRATGGRAAAS